MLAGQQVKAGIGVATIVPDIDFETYSEAGYLWDAARGRWGSIPGIRNTERGLKVVGVRNYVEHSTFEVLCLAYNLKDGSGAKSWRPGMRPPQDLLDHIRGSGLIEAWNVEFELTVWNYYCAPKWGWPPLQFEQLRCCMAKAAASAYPRSLDNAGEALRLPERKDRSGKDLVRKLTVPRNPTEGNPDLRWTPATAPEDFQQFYAYNVQDIIAESEASVRIPDLCPRELEIWQADQRINQRGMQLDVKGIDACIAIVEQAVQKYTEELRAITNGAVTAHTQVQETRRWLDRQGVYLDDLGEETVEAQAELDHAPAIKRVLKIRQLLSFGSVRKLYAMRAQVCADGRLRGQYAYHAAHTSLWNGRGVQVANLYKSKLDKPEKVEAALAAIKTGSLDYVEGVYGDALECVADCLRSMIIAAPGHRLIASDYTAIQAVVTAALAGERWQLDVFHTHGKIYEACAAMITGKTLEFYLDYRRQHGKHHEDRQPYGKIAQLSSGFAGWIGAWKNFGADEFMSDAEIKAAILKWRAASPMIVELWGGQTRDKFRRTERPELYGLEGAAIKAVLNPGICYAYRGIRYQMHGDALYCQPPGDGAPLVYHEPRLEPSQREYASAWELDLSYVGWNSNQAKGRGGWVRTKLYAGILTQNVVAKVAREYQADALVALDRTGLYLPVMHTHDEVVCETPDGQGSVDDYLAIVSRGKPWAVDDWGRPWPVRVPGVDETQRYGKWGG